MKNHEKFNDSRNLNFTTGIRGYTYNPCNQEVDAERSGIHSQPLLHNEFKDNVDYTRPSS